MCYIILPRPELIYYVQHCLYVPIGAIDHKHIHVKMASYSCWNSEVWNLSPPFPLLLMNLLFHMVHIDINLGIHYGGNKSKIARNEKRKVVWQILKHFNTLKQFTKHKPLISE